MQEASGSDRQDASSASWLQNLFKIRLIISQSNQLITNTKTFFYCFCSYQILHISLWLHETLLRSYYILLTRFVILLFVVLDSLLWNWHCHSAGKNSSASCPRGLLCCAFTFIALQHVQYRHLVCFALDHQPTISSNNRTRPLLIRI